MCAGRAPRGSPVSDVRVAWQGLKEERKQRERDGLVINDLPTVESKAPSHFGGVLLASARHAPLAPDKGYNTHDTLSLVYTAA